MRRSVDSKQTVSIVTGSNCGIGLETARGIAQTGGSVIVATRNATRGNRATEDLRGSTQNPRVEFVQLDLSSLTSIRSAAENILSRHRRIDLLINNAGVLNRRRHETTDGFELTFGVNHLGHFLFTRLLLDRIQKTAQEHGGARIINLSSTAHRNSKGLDFDDLMYQARPYRWFAAYSDSKLANILFTDALARRLSGTRVVTHAVHPGLVRSELARRENVGGLIWSAFAAGFLLTGIDTRKGAETSLAAALSPEAQEVSGKYWEKSKVATPTLPAGAGKMADRLWEVSTKLTRRDPG